MQSLPTEISFAICRYLDVISLCQLQKVNKQFACILNAALIWKERTATFPPLAAPSLLGPPVTPQEYKVL